MDGLKRYVNGDRFRVDGDKNMRLIAFAFTIVFVWTGPQNRSAKPKHYNNKVSCTRVCRCTGP